MDNQVMQYEDVLLLNEAKHKMHNISWSMRQLNKVASKTDVVSDFIPEKIASKIQVSINTILEKLVLANLKTIKSNKEFKKPSNKTYKAITTASGAFSGFFGSTTGVGTAIFASEFGLTTKFMLRSIMDIARSYGEDLKDLDTQKACFEVFALGGESKDDDDLDIAYYSTRVALTQGLEQLTTSGIKKFVSIISARLGAMVTEKFLAQVVPVLGAFGGGAINLVFINHYQKMAEAHFAVRSLERKYSKDLVQETFKDIKVIQDNNSK